jgi:hypothetical protein
LFRGAAAAFVNSGGSATEGQSIETGNLGRNWYLDLPAWHCNYDLNLRELPPRNGPERTNYGQKTRAIAEDRLRQTVADEHRSFCEKFGLSAGTPHFFACGQELGIIRQKQADRAG